MRLLALMLLIGCPSKGDAGRDPDAPGTDDTDGPTEPGDTDLPSDTDTDPTTGPGTGAPTRLEVACAATANALRFECTVDVAPAQPVELTFVRADGLSATRTVSSADVSTQHVLPMYFMAPEQDYDVTVRATDWPEPVATTTVTTGPPVPLVTSSLTMTGTSTMGMIGTHLPCGSAAVAVVYDTTTGDLLWYQLMDAGGTLGVNDMVQFTEDLTVLGESEGDVIEVDLMGNDLVRLNNLDAAFGVDGGGLFGNFHHDIHKRNGVYYVFYQEVYGGGGFDQAVLDNVILFDAAGTELARWYPIDHLALPQGWDGDFLHTNTVFVDEAGDILLSWLNQDTVGKIEGDWTSPDFGTPIWLLRGSGDGEVGSTFTIDWSLVGGDNQFDDQHSVMQRPDGRVQLLDNANGRGLVITIDEVAGTATVDGAYATAESNCGPQGTSRSTAGGNVVVGCTGDTVREYDVATGTMLWEAEVECPGGGFIDGAARWYPLDGW